jgi:hypothetical protein
MQNCFDEITKLLGASIPRRQALRAIGGIVGGVLLEMLGFERKAGAQVAPSQQLLCIQLCRSAQRVQNIWRRCMLICLGCPSAATQLCGAGGAIVCCPAGTVCLAGACTVPCGALGQPCCPGVVGTNVKGASSVKAAAVANICNPGLICIDGICNPNNLG